MDTDSDMETKINKLRLDKMLRLQAGMRVDREERERLKTGENPMDIVLYPAGPKK